MVKIFTYGNCPSVRVAYEVLALAIGQGQDCPCGQTGHWGSDYHCQTHWDPATPNPLGCYFDLPNHHNLPPLLPPVPCLPPLPPPRLVAQPGVGEV